MQKCETAFAKRKKKHTSNENLRWTFFPPSLFYGVEKGVVESVLVTASSRFNARVARG